MEEASERNPRGRPDEESSTVRKKRKSKGHGSVSRTKSPVADPASASVTDHSVSNTGSASDDTDLRRANKRHKGSRASRKKNSTADGDRGTPLSASRGAPGPNAKRSQTSLPSSSANAPSPDTLPQHLEPSSRSPPADSVRADARSPELTAIPERKAVASASAMESPFKEEQLSPTARAPWTPVSSSSAASGEADSRQLPSVGSETVLSSSTASGDADSRQLPSVGSETGCPGTPGRGPPSSASATLSPYNEAILSPQGVPASGPSKVSGEVDRSHLASPGSKLAGESQADSRTSLERMPLTSAGAMLSPFKEGMLSSQEQVQPCVPRAPTTASPSSVAAEQQPRHPGPQQPLQERKPIESKKGPLNNATLPVLVIVTLALVLVVAVVIFKVLLSVKSANVPRLYEVCNTAACQAYAGLLAATVNGGIDACRDFYGHVCDGWRKTHSTSVEGVLQRSFSNDVAKFLAAEDAGVAANNGPQSAVQKAARLYVSCEEIHTKGRDELGSFRSFFADIGVNWPNPAKTPDVLRTLLRLLALLELPVLVTIEVLAVTASEEPVVLDVRAEYHSVSEGKHRRQRTESLNRTREYFDAFFRAFNKQDQDILQYDHFRELEKRGLEIFATAAEPGSDNGAGVRRMQLEALVEATPAIPVQRWHTQLREQLRLASPPREVVASGRAQGMLRALNSLVTERGEREADLFVGWLALQEVGPLVSRNLALAANFTGSEATAHRDFRQRCVTLAGRLLGWAVFAPFVSKMTAARTTREDLRHVDTYTEWVLEAAIHDSSWIRQHAIANSSTDEGSFIHKMNEFPELSDLDAAYSSVPDMGEHLAHNWNISVDARRAMPADLWTRIRTQFHDPGDFQGGPLETPALSPMALLLPVYAGGANAALKYGALGSVAAASLLSGLDRRLQLAAHEESQRRLACYRRDPQAVDYDVNGHHGHGTAEASLALAWKAYEGAKGGTRLPGLETYSSDQLFFVAFAYQHCAAADYGAQEYRHVHAAVRNLDAFGHAFACDPGTPMNPTHKCSYF